MLATRTDVPTGWEFAALKGETLATDESSSTDRQPLNEVLAAAGTAEVLGGTV